MNFLFKKYLIKMNYFTLILLILILIYFFILVSTYFFQRNLLYHPSFNNYSGEQIIVPIEKVIDDVNPNIVFVPNITDTDQDHRSVANACLVACRSIPSLFSYEIPGPSIDFQPNYYLDIEQYFELKIAAMEKYSDEWRTFPHPRSPEGLKIVAQYRGIQYGLNYAEAYKLIKHTEKSMHK